MPEQSELPSEIVEAVVRGVRRGHDIAARAHVDEEGWDSTTFGTNRYRLTWHWVTVELDQVDGVELVDPTSCLRARWEDIEIGFYNGGIGDGWDPNTFEFDATARRAEVGFANMEPLPGFGNGPALKHLLVVYTGSTQRGCLKIYLGAPVTDPLSGKTSWAWLAEIWSASDGDGGSRANGERDYPPFRDLDPGDTEVGLRDDDEAGTGDETGTGTNG